jgi:endonuclease YncB( thermonuclease family)
MADDKEIVLSEKRYQSLLSDLHKLINEGRTKAQSAMNRELMTTYWNCGKRIAEEKITENGGYGTSIMERLAKELGTDRPTLVRCQWFHRYYLDGAPTETGLVWSHYRELITLKDEKAREFYEKEAEEKRWTRDELVRAIHADHIIDVNDPNKDRKKVQLKRPGGGPFVFRAEILHVADGDTLTARLDLGFDVWKKEIIRFAGINAPPLKEDGGEDAFAYVRDQMGKAKVVVIRTGKEDLHGRYVGHIFYSLDERDDWEKVFREGRWLNQEMINLGLARTY